MTTSAAAKTWYVYALCDPDTEQPFYVGKGSGDRMDIHESNHYRNHDTNRAKQACIKRIQASGKSVVKRKIAEFDDEQDAFVYELATIIAYSAQLTNISMNYGVAMRARKETPIVEEVVAPPVVEEEKIEYTPWFEDGGILTLEEVADLFRWTRKTVMLKARAGVIKGFKAANKWRFRQAAIDRFIAQQEQAQSIEHPKE